MEAAGGRAVLTDPALPSGSDRILAALDVLDPARLHDAVINLQGDLPAIDPAIVAAALKPLADLRIGDQLVTAHGCAADGRDVVVGEFHDCSPPSSAPIPAFR